MCIRTPWYVRRDTCSIRNEERIECIRTAGRADRGDRFTDGLQGIGRLRDDRKDET